MRREGTGDRQGDEREGENSRVLFLLQKDKTSPESQSMEFEPDNACPIPRYRTVTRSLICIVRWSCGVGGEREDRLGFSLCTCFIRLRGVALTAPPRRGGPAVKTDRTPLLAGHGSPIWRPRIPAG